MILALETATRNCSVALFDEGRMVSLCEYAGEGYSHAEKLHVFIETVLREAGISYKELSAVAVSCGPGSYTGLRIGVSAAKGLCFALGIPLISVDTMRVLALRAPSKADFIVPMLDARRMEVYASVFDANLNEIKATHAEILTEDSFAGLNGSVLFLGDANQKAKTVLTDSRFEFAPDVSLPSAREMGIPAYTKFQNADFENLAYFEPFYLKDFLVSAPKASK